MRRIPEPELMDEPEQARAYAEEDFSESNELFLSLLDEIRPLATWRGRALDLGCGPADILVRLGRRNQELGMLGLDGAEAMLAHGRDAVAAAGLGERIELTCEYLPAPRLAAGSFELLLSNSLLHHLADPHTLWREILRLARPGAAVLMMDLRRPPDRAAVDELVERYAALAPPVLREDFRNSLIAAYRVDEVEAQLRVSGLEHLRVAEVSDRHLAAWGYLP